VLELEQTNREEMMKETKSERKRLTEEVAERLVREYGLTTEAVFGEGGLMKELSRAVLEKVLEGELTHHLGYARGGRRTEAVEVGAEMEAGEREVGGVESEEEPARNCRNGKTRKRVKSPEGEMEIAVPRDRAGSFEPIMIRKGQRRFEGFDQRIIAMYARGMTVREIQAFLEEQYAVEVSAEFISTVTATVMEEVKEWQGRPLEKLYSVVFFDALRIKVRDEGTVKNKAVYFALGVDAQGQRDVLGFWLEQTEGAKFWQRVMSELRNRGVEDILIAVVDGLKGFPEAITAVYPETTVQTCIVHLLRHSLSYCNWQDRKAVAAELKGVYQAATAELARERLEEFSTGKWGKKYPVIVASWERAWEEVIPFYSYPPEIRKLLYTTNAIESFHMQLRKVLKNRGHFPNDEAAARLIYLALRNIVAKWKAPSLAWMAASNQFALLYPERFRR
jgi:transposase-like protein